MSDVLPLALALLGGGLFGTFFFGGLWWTVEKGITSDNPAIWFLCSLFLRTGVVLAGFYFVSQGHWSRLVACLLGFLIARIFVVRWLSRATEEEDVPLQKETSLAP